MDLPIQRLELPPTTFAWSGRRSRSGRSGTGVRFATIGDLAAFEALEAEWDDLFASSGQPHQVFQSFGWLKLWARRYVDRVTRLAVVTARLDGRLVAAWPLVVRHQPGLRLLVPMGEPLTQYCDALLGAGLGPDGEDALLAHVMALPADVVSFHRVRDDAAIAGALGRRFGTPVNRQAAPCVDLAGVADAAAFTARFPGKVRASRRRRLRRLEERGRVSIARPARGEASAAAVAQAFAFKRDWARREGIVSPSLCDPRFEQVFRDAALAGGAVAQEVAPDLRVSIMRCGEEVLGIELSLACKGRLTGHVLAPRPGLDGFGLGGILAEQTILDAIERGFEAVDLLAPADPYKLAWTTRTVGVGDYIVAKGVRGALYKHLWLRHGRDCAKAAARRLRPVMKRLRPVSTVDPG